MKKIVIVGAGSMAEALISGIVKNDLLDPKNIWTTNRTNEERLVTLNKQYGVQFTYDIKELFEDAEVVVLAMKPKDALQAIKQIRSHLTKQMLIISVLAGIAISAIEELAEKPLAIARAMPNTSATVGKSATAIAVNKVVSSNQLETIKHLFGTVGLTTFVPEDQLDAVTGLSGSGPAYIYYLVEAMENSAVEIGLERQMAKELIVQTLIGAAEMLKSTTKPSKQLRQEVTSPGGTTEAGIQILEEHKVQQAFISCIKAAAIQSKKMGIVLCKELNSAKQSTL
ncbi:pyrroline-5-carboxylate reductase [Neobacillus sp. PS3-40]|uniref:pyrroline-5-carboxylate reductase n=1 Tax=Neobacillus sp. PS3-40 TaxID=3070679 RepID=UPI0027E057FA|nr:pyrroline-5-carboxylate reductase [Neobacillus sp. PS3-40]WML45207.1 pyrroline-5-carboxylate reductase [Neobacillus sp. PS3-40]